MNFLGVVFRWWVVLFGLGLLSFPIAFWLFRKFWDGGWALAKILGVLFVSYWVWIVGSLRVFSFNIFSIWLGILLLFYFSYLAWLRVGKSLQRFVRSRWQLLVFEELLFAIGLLTWSWVRAHQPDIHGLEKFMDFGFLNSIMRTRFFPPADMWLAGETINYYYFGHLATAVVTKLSGLSSTLTYNLAIATILGFTFSGAFSLASTLVGYLIPKLASRRRFFLVLAGLVSAIVITFSGNLHAALTIISKGTASYWYPDATRFIPYTIHEFPIYSFVVSDLHGHVSNIPFVILTLSMLLMLLAEYRKRRRFSLFLPETFWRLLGLGFMLGILYMTNALDAPIYLTLIGVSFVACLASRLPLKKAIIKSGIALAVVTSAAFLVSLPFHLNFAPFTSGVALVQARSTVWQLLVLWGFFLFVGVVLLILVFMQNIRRFFSKPLLDPIFSRFMIIVFSTSVLLVIVPEIMYFKDIYIAEYHRANTMFKLVYQTFVLMSLVTGPVFVAWLWQLIACKRGKLRIFLSAIFIAFIIGLASILVYPYFAVGSYYNRFQSRRGLDGIAWLAREYPDDFVVVSWLREKIVGQPVIAEAVGESYSDFARVSANTGLPTVLGWRVHEWLWRGSFDEAGLRTGEVESLYTLGDIKNVCSIVNKYAIEYIFVGVLERQQYPKLKEQLFGQIGELVFSQGASGVYRIRKPCGSFAL